MHMRVCRHRYVTIWFCFCHEIKWGLHRNQREKSRASLAEEATDMREMPLSYASFPEDQGNFQAPENS